MDGVRGLAAVLVLLRHSEDFWPAQIFHSYLAVDVFFLLSGYVISRAYGERLRSGALTAGRFMTIRLIRLYPMFLLSALWVGSHLLVATELHIGHIGLAPLLTVVGTLLMLPVNLIGTQLLFPLNSPCWSLFFELVVNQFYALVVRRWSVRAVMALAGAAAVMLVIDSLRRNGLDLGFKTNAVSLSAGLARAMFGILLGALLEQHAGGWRLTRALRAHPWIAIAALTLVLVSPSAGAWNGVVDILLVAAVLPACVLALDAPVRRPALSSGLIALGAASYPLYVLQVPAIDLAERLAAGEMPTHPLTVGILFVVVMILLCIALERRVDEPARRRLQRWLLPRPGGRSPREPASAELPGGTPPLTFADAPLASHTAPASSKAA